MSAITFENGSPAYTGEMIPCFKDQGNGLLFRIVNEEESKWAFYNDTTGYNMVVTVVFGVDSEVEPLGNTKCDEDDETGQATCTVTVGPASTEMFIEGVVNGFKISFRADPIPRKK